MAYRTVFCSSHIFTVALVHSECYSLIGINFESEVDTGLFVGTPHPFHLATNDGGWSAPLMAAFACLLNAANEFLNGSLPDMGGSNAQGAGAVKQSLDQAQETKSAIRIIGRQLEVKQQCLGLFVQTGTEDDIAGLLRKHPQREQ